MCFSVCTGALVFEIVRLKKSVFRCMYRCACVLNCQVEEECV